MSNVAMAKWLLLKLYSNILLQNFITMVITVLYQFLYYINFHDNDYNKFYENLTGLYSLFLPFTIYLHFIQLFSVTGLYSFIKNSIYLTIQLKFFAVFFFIGFALACMGIGCFLVVLLQYEPYCELHVVFLFKLLTFLLPG